MCNFLFKFLEYCPDYKIHALDTDKNDPFKLKLQVTFGMTKANVRLCACSKAKAKAKIFYTFCFSPLLEMSSSKK